MRASVASRSTKLLSIFFAATLVFGLVPVAAFAETGDAAAGTIPDDVAGSVSAEDFTSEALQNESEDDAVASSDGEGPSEGGAGSDDVEDPVSATPAGGIINEELPLDAVVAQTESTKSFFLARALESTRTVPMVSAKLPIDDGSEEEGVGAGEGAEEGTPKREVSTSSTVMGAFERDGMTFAIEADGESVALMAVDYAKLPKEFVEKQVIAIPETVSPDAVDSYSVTRIANGALSSLKKKNANPDHAGARALFSDEELLSEAGIDPAEVEAFLTDESAAGTARGSEDADASSDVQAQVEGCASGEEVAAKSSEGDGSSDPVDGTEPSVSVEGDESVDPAEVDKTSSGEVRTIVSMDGDVAKLDDGSTYVFKNPLAGCTGILAANIPSSVSSIEDEAFAGFETLQYIVVSDDNPEYASYDGALYSADLATLRLIPEGRVGAVRVAPNVTDVDPEVFSHCPLVDCIVADPDGAVHEIAHKRILSDNCELSSIFSPLEHLADTALISSYRLKSNTHIPPEGGASLLFDPAADHPDARQTFAVTYYSGYIIGSWRVGCGSTIAGVKDWTSKSGTGSKREFLGSPGFWRCVDGYIEWFPQASSVTDCVGVRWYILDTDIAAAKKVWYYGLSKDKIDIPVPSNWTRSPGLTFYVQCKEELSFDITWNSNGGSAVSDWSVPQGQSLANNTTGNTSLPKPTRTGWVFDGWYKSNSSFTSANKLSSTLSSTTPTADTTYYARWKISWTWRAYGTTSGATQIVKYSPGDYSTSTAYSAVSATAPSSCSNKPVGWELSTWSRSSTNNSGAISPGSTVAPYSTAGSFTYYARWKAQIKRNLNTGNGASVDVSNLTTIYASGSAPTATYKPSDVSRTGYTFDGWNVDYESASIADDNSKYKNVTVTFKGAATIVAQWTPEKRNVTWNATGGTDRTTSADYDTQHTAPTQGTGSTQTSLSGWTLEGWYTDAACTTGRIAPGGKTAAVTANTTYYAKWTRTITFKAQGGSGGDKTATATRTGSDKTGTFTTPAAPTRSNWTFKGWTASATRTSYTAANKSTTSATATWYARWEMSVTLNANGGALASGVTSPIKVLNSGTSPFDNHVQLSAGIPVRTGYAFDGWRAGSASGARVDANGTVPAGTIGGDQTLYAAWRINTYHLSWDVPHGSHANRTSDFTVEDCPIAMGAAIPDAGYAFQGWSGTGIAAGSNSFTVTSSMLEGKGDGETLAYAASITANPYTVRLHANDGTDAVASHDVAYDAAVSSVSIPKRYGYAFAGYWTKDADGTKEELYFDEDGSYVRDSGVWKGLSDVDLYACWTLMANLEVPINAPGTVGLAVDRATVVGEDAAGVLTGESVSGALRSAVPQEVPVASIELEALQGADGSTVVSRILGAGNPERCGVEVSLGSSNKALLRLAGETSSMLWVPAAGSAPRIPAAVSAPENASGEGIVTDDLGNAGHMGELPLSYAMRLFPGFDVYRMPEEDTTSEPAARIVFTVDLTGLSREEF